MWSTKSFALSAHRPGAREGSVPLHSAVVAHIRNGEPEQARTAMITLLESAREDLDKVLAQNGAGVEQTPSNTPGPIPARAEAGGRH